MIHLDIPLLSKDNSMMIISLIEVIEKSVEENDGVIEVCSIYYINRILRSIFIYLDTLRFYQALKMCGTDFTLIARYFPNRDRDDIKRKFKTEDKANRTAVDSALRTLRFHFCFSSTSASASFSWIIIGYSLGQRIPFDLTCFFSPSEESTNDENGSDVEQIARKKTRKRRVVKRKSKQVCI